MVVADLRSNLSAFDPSPSQIGIHNLRNRSLQLLTLSASPCIKRSSRDTFLGWLCLSLVVGLNFLSGLGELDLFHHIYHRSEQGVCQLNQRKCSSLLLIGSGVSREVCNRSLLRSFASRSDSFCPLFPLFSSISLVQYFWLGCLKRLMASSPWLYWMIATPIALASFSSFILAVAVAVISRLDPGRNGTWPTENICK